jgi:hypothetical protein
MAKAKKGTRCMALDEDGNRCENDRNTESVFYHGDHEIYYYSNKRPSWVIVWLCPDHRRDNDPNNV